MNYFVREFLAIAVAIFWSREVFNFVASESLSSGKSILTLFTALVFLLLLTEYVHVTGPSGVRVGYRRVKILSLFAISGTVISIVGIFMMPLGFNAFWVTALSIIAGAIAQILVAQGEKASGLSGKWEK